MANFLGRVRCAAPCCFFCFLFLLVVIIAVCWAAVVCGTFVKTNIFGTKDDDDNNDKKNVCIFLVNPYIYILYLSTRRNI